jgi:hypothetical protein
MHRPFLFGRLWRERTLPALNLRVISQSPGLAEAFRSGIPLAGSRPMPRHRSDGRIEVRLPLVATARRYREVRAFACFCIARLEREVGALDGWILTIDVAPAGFIAQIAARVHETELQGQGAGRDSTLAVWDAFCNVEQSIREELRAA